MSKSIIKQKRILTKSGGGAGLAIPVTVPNGGTGLSSYTVGDLIYASGVTTLSKLAIGTAGQLLKVNAGATAVEYFTPSYISGITVGTTTSTGTNGRLLFSLSGVVNESASVYIDQSGTNFDVRLGRQIGAGGVGYTGSSNVLLGHWVGYNMTSGADNVYIGAGAAGVGSSLSNGGENVAVGSGAMNNAGNQFYTTAVGYRAGYGSTNFRGIYFGHNAGNGNTNQGIIIGYDPPNTTAAHQAIFGSNDANGYIDNFYFNGVTHTAAYSINLRATGGSGSNNVAANLNLYAGLSTGSGTPATMGFYSSAAGASSSTAQTAVKVLEITNSTTITTSDAVNYALGSTTGTKFGTANTQKLAFWNSTPVVQQILATGAGATVDNVITLLQTLGLCKQS